MQDTPMRLSMGQSQIPDCHEDSTTLWILDNRKFRVVHEGCDPEKLQPSEQDMSDCLEGNQLKGRVQYEHHRHER